MSTIIADIKAGKTSLGIELGSTRIKAVLTDSTNRPIAIGGHEWQNRIENGIWTYTIEDIWQGIEACYRSLAEEIKSKYNIILKTIGAIGISGMMHGYMAFDENDELLVPFRTWRNTMTGKASEELTNLFEYPIPQRWSIAHLYQAIINNEAHIKKIKHITTLAGYVHWKLTGEKVLGVGEASGMFPIDISVGKYNDGMIKKFDEAVAGNKFPWQLKDLLPEVKTAGELGGYLTSNGAKLLDIDGNLEAGIQFCPPEGDAGTGMTATNSIAKRTGNVSAGTSVFAMVVLEREMKAVHEEIDLVTTPTGKLVAMVHCNNCTSDLNAWTSLFGEFAELIGAEISKEKLYKILYNKALEGEKDCGNLLAYNYYSGEHVTGFTEGRPLFVRTPESKFSLSNFMRVHLYTSLGALKTGLDILLKKEDVKVEKISGHGGLFKTEAVGQKILAAAINAPVSVMQTAGEGGAWGIALLASYMVNKQTNETLEEYLNSKVFAEYKAETIYPDEEDVQGFNVFIERYKTGLAIERAAVDALK